MRVIIKSAIKNQDILVDKLVTLISMYKSRNLSMFLVFVVSSLIKVLPWLHKYLKYRRYKYETHNFVLSANEKTLKDVLWIKIDNKVIPGNCFEVGAYFLLIRNYVNVSKVVYIDDICVNGIELSMKNKISIKFKHGLVKSKMINDGDSTKIYAKLYCDNKEYADFLCVDKDVPSEGIVTFRMQKETFKTKIRTIFDPNLYPCYDEIKNAIASWKENREKYQMLGGGKISFLFVGSPGCGKTLLARHLAVLAGYNEIGELYIDSENRVTSKIKKNAVLIFDDIDILCSYNRENDTYDEAKAKCFSSLMQLLDGDSIKDCIIVFTTNYPEKFDSALFRPGRIDYQIKFDELDFERITNFVKKWYDIIDTSNMTRKTATSATLLSTIKHNINNYESFCVEWNQL